MKTWFAVILFFVLLEAIPLSTHAATLTASLDRGTISLGETATLSLTFEGESPEQTPAIVSPTNLRISYLGQSSQFTMVNGRTSSTVSHNYQVTPTQPGDYVIPSVQVKVRGTTLASQPIRLKVQKPSDAATGGDGQTKLAFVKLIVPKTTVYVGEVFPVEVQLYVVAADKIQMPQMQSDGFLFGTMPQPSTRSQTQINNQIYTVLPFQVAATAIKTGQLSIGPVQIGLVLHIRRNPPDPFDLLSSRLQGQPVTLASEAQSIQVLPLPEENKPAQFNGAVGNYSLVASASPTNVVVGDPITLKIQITGQGTLDALTLPALDDWREFKTYPPTSKIESKDALGISGVKSFEQVVIPQNAEVKELPPVLFSFFDPEQKAYRTLRNPPISLAIRPSTASQPQPTVIANPQQPAAVPPVRDIVHIKPQLGMVTALRPPLVHQPWFLLLQGAPLLLWLSAAIWRKRRDAIANDPRLRRRLQVAESVRKGLKQLPGLAAENQAEEFFAGVFRLLQEQLGERLDLPASAITEAVIGEYLPARGADQALLDNLHELFQLCNQARYAPHRTSGELISLLPRIESAIRDLQKLAGGNRH